MTFRPGVHPLTILHAPCHGPTVTPHHIRHALTLGACSVGFSELYERVPYLRERPSWRTTVGNPPNDTHDELRGAHDAPIATRRHHEQVRSFAMRACDASTPLKLAPPRWVQSDTYVHPLGDVEHITAHPNAAVVGLDPARVDRVKKYVATMGVLERRIKLALKRKRLVVVTGDLNYPALADVVDWSPHAMFARTGLKVWAIGVDYVAHGPGLRPVDRQVITDNGQDHPWMMRRFVRE